MDRAENYSKADKLARDVLVLSRNTLLVNLRFLDMALSQLPYVIADTTVTTDGKYLYYEPMFLLRVYKEEKEAMTRGYLHVIMHCVYRHMFVHSLVDQRLWDLACDIAVEASIQSLDIHSVHTKRNGEKAKEIERFKESVKLVTAEKLYACFIDEPLSEDRLAQLEVLFAFDDHSIWYMDPVKKRDSLGLDSSSGVNDRPNSGNGEPGETEKSSSMGMQESIWKDVSERLQQDLETFSKTRGDTAGQMMQNLKSVNREKYDYTSFLKKFAVIGEAMKINDDEFDYIFYTYGLSCYGNMPLIEPLEYKEVKRIREFVIAIDTSGSVSGELVQTFLQKTYNILLSSESFFSKINVHIIQCDAKIQEDIKIASKKEFDEYLKTMTIKGLGGTDFRPVFKYVDELRRNGEYTNLKGLIYFTDGYGTFPSQMPDYKTAFVFVDEGYDVPEIPSWAIRLVLQKEDI